MGELSKSPTLKEINALKKKLSWGEVPNIYNLFATSISDMDGVLMHGFDNPYKQLLDKSNLNIELLGQFRNEHGELQLKTKPQLILHHSYDQDNYELHCHLVMNEERVFETQRNNPDCPFILWRPESMKTLFKLKAIIPFISYAIQKGDEADLALLKFSHIRSQQLIDHLRDFFDIVKVQGYTIEEFCQEIASRRSLNDMANFTQLFLEK